MSSFGVCILEHEHLRAAICEGPQAMKAQIGAEAGSIYFGSNQFVIYIADYKGVASKFMRLLGLQRRRMLKRLHLTEGVSMFSAEDVSDLWSTIRRFRTEDTLGLSPHAIEFRELVPVRGKNYFVNNYIRLTEAPCFEVIGEGEDWDLKLKMDWPNRMWDEQERRIVEVDADSEDWRPRAVNW